MKNKQYDINDIYLLHILEQSFYVPMCEGECYFYDDIEINKEFYVLALKKRDGVYADLNSFKRFKENETIGFGYVDYINRIIPLKDALKNEDLLYNIEIKEVIDKIMVNNNKVLKKMKGNR